MVFGCFFIVVNLPPIKHNSHRKPQSLRSWLSKPTNSYVHSLYVEVLDILETCLRRLCVIYKTKGNEHQCTLKYCSTCIYSTHHTQKTQTFTHYKQLTFEGVLYFTFTFMFLLYFTRKHLNGFTYRAHRYMSLAFSRILNSGCNTTMYMQIDYYKNRPINII